MKRIFLFLSLFFFTCQTAFPQCWTQVVGGGYHTVAIKSDGSLWAWGKNIYGQLGDGTFENKLRPVRIGNDSDWEYVSAGSEHTVAIKKDGTLWAWGQNLYGQVGDDTYTDCNVPKRISADKNWKTISAGSIFNLALKTDGSMWSWGWNDHYELGNGNTFNLTVPTMVGRSFDWDSVSASTLSATAIKTDNSIWSWGANVEGSLGAVTLQFQVEPAQIGTTIFNYKTTSSGGFTSMNIKLDGTLWGWGFNGYGTVGNGTSSNVSVPTKIGNDHDWAIAVTSTSTTRAIKNNGSLWVWGKNDIGQLGDGTTQNRNVPVRIAENTVWKTISGRRDFTVALDTDNGLWAWGDNSFGQLGDGTTENQTIPEMINSECISLALLAANDVQKLSLKMYPNPATNILHLESDNLIDHIKISDMTGKILFEQSGNISSVSVQHLPQGIYILQAFSGKDNFQSRFVKE